MSQTSDALSRIGAIIAGAAVGALLRHVEGLALPGPRGTLAINVIGSALLGALLAAGPPGERAHATWLALLGTGFCGAYTTFSTFALEVCSLAAQGERALAAGYALGAVLLGVAAAWLGARACERLSVRSLAAPPPLLAALAFATALAVGIVIASGGAWGSAGVVVLGGCGGSLLRAFLGAALAQRLGVWGTTVINVTGSGMIGLLHGAVPDAPPLVRQLLATGLLGGYTTFSTFAADTVGLARTGSAPRAVLHAAVTLAGCLAACASGHLLGEHFAR